MLVCQSWSVFLYDIAYLQKSNAYNYEIKVVPCWNHSYGKQELFSASQSAKLSKYKQVPFYKFSQIYIPFVFSSERC